MSAADEQRPLLYEATLRLLSLLATSRLEKDLLQQGIEALAAILQARYGAIRLIDDTGRLQHFVHTGVGPEVAELIGQPPEGCGLLGVTTPLRLSDMSRDPRFTGFPPHHPPMKTLLSVPLSQEDRSYGRVYLSAKNDGSAFNQEDERLLAHFSSVFAMMLAYHRNQTEREHSTKMLREISHALSAITGDAFFRVLVLNLTRALGVAYALIGEVTDASCRAVRTVAVGTAGKLADKFFYGLDGTPCENVVDKETCFYARDVQRLFPDDRMLAAMGIESYVGSPLFDSQGNPLGILVLLDRKPLADPEHAQSILKICAARAGAELERQRAEKALLQNEEHYHLLARLAPVGIFRTDAQGHCTYTNKRWCDIAGIDPAQARGEGWVQAIHPDDRQHIFDRWYAAAKNDLPFVEECRMQRPDGVTTWVLAQASAERGADGRVTGYVGSVTDITERKLADKNLRESNELLERIFDSTHFCLGYLDRDFNFIRVNQAYAKTCGHPPEYFPGKNHFQIYPHEENEAIFRRVVQTGEPFTAIAKPFEYPDHPEWGVTYWDWTLHPLKDDAGNVEAVLFVLLDVTERRRTEDQLNALAYYDALTGLPNRQQLHDHLRWAMKDAANRERLVAILFLDLDRFKNINDTLGHDVGDALLKEVAVRLKTSVRPGDVISRLGGDEFTIVLANIAHLDDVTRVAQKLLDHFLPPFRIAGRDLFISPSIGITLYPFDGNNAEDLIKNADIAMYHAKELGRNNFQFYTPELNVRAARRLELETGLRLALERNEFVLHFQPLVKMDSGKITGMEALLRWQHPEYGLIPPMEFIPLAEETGLIVPIGEWVLRAACAQIKAWHDAGFPAMHVAVNLSSVQLQQKNFVDVVKRALRETGLEPRYLDLELTETLLMQDMEAAEAILKELHALGVLFSLDDFGTGYSSLSYLKRFPIDFLKIDRSFVRDITRDRYGAGIVRAIIVMAHTLGIKVIAEGVETAGHFRFLRQQGCDISQGYYCSRPLATESFTELLRDWRHMQPGKCLIRKTVRKPRKQQARPKRRARK
jgi:diguanylate cyclase (GGDEF)-like protein/PAS domain S-box-containing protein